MRPRVPAGPPPAAISIHCAPAPDRIRACAREACALHFFDRAGNGTRRWCSMAVCGDRATASGTTPAPKRTGKATALCPEKYQIVPHGVSAAVADLRHDGFTSRPTLHKPLSLTKG
ncbi:CGNR zinc finger domain-containing protein [Streptomyces sp. NPDC005279]|uniref:CGNR zinc finger domain-containing protein n=1 Tax=Streptomyces sp. NPDC005279 TaxID=3364712 RepID=UPI0036941263